MATAKSTTTGKTTEDGETDERRDAICIRQSLKSTPTLLGI